MATEEILKQAAAEAVLHTATGLFHLLGSRDKAGWFDAPLVQVKHDALDYLEERVDALDGNVQKKLELKAQIADLVVGLILTFAKAGIEVAANKALEKLSEPS